MQRRRKLFVGVVLIITNFIVGKVAVPLFAVNTGLAITVYLISWLMLIVGLILCGRQGLSRARQYYRHLERRIKTKATKRFKHKSPPQVRADLTTPVDV
jgi:hypothetical protein